MDPTSVTFRRCARALGEHVAATSNADERHLLRLLGRPRRHEPADLGGKLIYEMVDLRSVGDQ